MSDEFHAPPCHFEGALATEKSLTWHAQDFSPLRGSK